MAGLTLEKTWVREFAQSINSSSDSTKHRSLLFAIKKALTTGTAAWTVLGSCDSVSYGIDAVDRWIDYGDVVFGTNFSWIVLQQTGIGDSPNYTQMLISATTDTSDYQDVYVRFTCNKAFVGGDLSTMPDVVDADRVSPCSNNYYWMGRPTSSTAQYNVNVLRTTDGSCTRVVIGEVGLQPRVFWQIDTLKNPASWVDLPVLVSILPAYNATYWNRDLLTGSTYGFAWYTYSNTHGWLNGKLVTMMYSGNVICDNTPFDTAGLDSQFALCPVGHRVTDSLAKGRSGDVYDLYMVSYSLTDGQSLADGNGDDYKFVALGGLAFPNDGTVVNWY